MRDMIVSIVIFFMIIGGWIVFCVYSDNTINDFNTYISNTLLPSVEKGDWKSSSAEIDELNREWERYKVKALLFLNTEDINEIDYSIARTMKYIKSQDVSNSSGELNSIVHQLRYLIDKERITAANIF